MTAPAYFVETMTPSGAWFLDEDAACADLADAVNAASKALSDWPDFRVWATPADAVIHDATAKIKAALAASYEANGYWYDTIPTALVDYASDELQRAHADDQAAQLDADCWLEAAE